MSGEMQIFDGLVKVVRDRKIGRTLAVISFVWIFPVNKDPGVRVPAAAATLYRTILQQDCEHLKEQLGRSVHMHPP